MLPCGTACGGGAREGTVQLACSSLVHFPKMSCETGSFSHCSNPCQSPQSALSLSFAFSQPHPHGPLPCHRFSQSACLTSLVGLVDCFFNSLVVRVPGSLSSGTSGCLLILDWLCEEVKCFYLCLHLGWNSYYFIFILNFTLWNETSLSDPHPTPQPLVGALWAFVLSPVISFHRGMWIKQSTVVGVHRWVPTLQMPFPWRVK